MVKFGYPASLVRDYDTWVVLVRPGQCTLGALVLGFAFFISNGIGLALGEVGLVPPVIAGWAAIVGFSAVTGAIAFSREVHDTSVRFKSTDVP